jgi:gluconate 2-dehydrogenase alpha chain
MREMGAFKPGEMVGGTAAHWGGNARRFLPHDFQIRSRIKEPYGQSFIPEDCSLQDWGVTWDEIQPYYDQFEEIFGVGCKAGNLNGEIQTGGNPHEVTPEFHAGSVREARHLARCAARLCGI